LQPRFSFSLDAHSGVPLYRQLIDQVLSGIASGSLVTGDQLPTVRQTAVDLSINLNTVARAYRELEIRGVLMTQQGSGTFIATKKTHMTETERRRRLAQIAEECAARAGSEGFALSELIETLKEMLPEKRKREEHLC